MARRVWRMEFMWRVRSGPMPELSDWVTFSPLFWFSSSSTTTTRFPPRRRRYPSTVLDGYAGVLRFALSLASALLYCLPAQVLLTHKLTAHFAQMVFDFVRTGLSNSEVLLSISCVFLTSQYIVPFDHLISRSTASWRRPAALHLRLPRCPLASMLLFSPFFVLLISSTTPW